MQRSQFAGCGSHNYCIVHGAGGCQSFNQLCNCGRFLAYGNIDTDNILSGLVDNCVDGNGCFACLTVADDKFTLAAADRYHTVDSFNTGLQRNAYAFSFYYAAGRGLYGAHLFGIYWAFAVYRSTQAVYYTADKAFTCGNGNNSSGAFYHIALFNAFIGAEDNQ